MIYFKNEDEIKTFSGKQEQKKSCSKYTLQEVLKFFRFKRYNTIWYFGAIGKIGENWKNTYVFNIKVFANFFYSQFTNGKIMCDNNNK